MVTMDQLVQRIIDHCRMAQLELLCLEELIGPTAVDDKNKTVWCYRRIDRVVTALESFIKEVDRPKDQTQDKEEGEFSVHVTTEV